MTHRGRLPGPRAEWRGVSKPPESGMKRLLFRAALAIVAAPAHATESACPSVSVNPASTAASTAVTIRGHD